MLMKKRKDSRNSGYKNLCEKKQMWMLLRVS